MYWRSVWLVLAAIAFSTTVAASAATVPKPIHVANTLLQLPDERLNIGDAALEISALVIPEVNRQQGNAMLDDIARRVGRLVGSRTDPDFRIRAINTVLFRELGFAYDAKAIKSIRANTPQLRTLWHVLATHRGNCVSLPLLWYAVAERLQYPVFAVTAPQHFFLRYDDGKYRTNIEATSGGGYIGDDKMAVDLDIPEEGVRSGAYLRTLSKREYLALLVADAATPYLLERQHRLALPLLESALRVAPRSADTHAQLARALQIEARAQGDAALGKRALEHARTATALGLAAPLKDSYWDDFLARKSAEGTPAAARARPFVIENWLEQLAGDDDAFVQEVHNDLSVERPDRPEPARPPRAWALPSGGMNPTVSPAQRRPPGCGSVQMVVENAEGLGGRLSSPDGCGSNVQEQR